MKVVFIKDQSKRYLCSICDKQFNWSEDSSVWGKLEYETIQEELDTDKFFCSEECYKKFVKNHYEI